MTQDLGQKELDRTAYFDLHNAIANICLINGFENNKLQRQYAEILISKIKDEEVLEYCKKDLNKVPFIINELSFFDGGLEINYRIILGADYHRTYKILFLIEDI